MEIIMEVLFDLFMELFFLFVPKEKRRSKAYTTGAFLTAVILFFAVIALVLWGVFLITEQNNPLGKEPIVIAVIISILVIVFGIINYNKNH